MNTIAITRFGCRADAESYQRRLTETGIPAHVHDSSSLKGARIDVPAGQFERAYGLMQSWDAAEGGIRGAIRCPECHSLRVEYPQYTHKSSLPNLLIGALANIGALPKEFYCYDCHFTWPKEGTRPSRKRPHMAPYYFIEGVPQQQQEELEHARQQHRHAA
jgi:hypothetical protein